MCISSLIKFIYMQQMHGFDVVKYSVACLFLFYDDDEDGRKICNCTVILCNIGR